MQIYKYENLYYQSPEIPIKLAKSRLQAFLGHDYAPCCHHFI